MISLYQGGEYWLYRYKKYTDVRIVFAPEEQAAFFGGDPDNFTYPRYDLDMALFRVYENGKPHPHRELFEVECEGPGGKRTGVCVGESGFNTARRHRCATDARARRCGARRVEAFAAPPRRAEESLRAQGPEQAREAETQIFYLENSLKAFEGRLQGLLDPHVFGKKVSEETEFRAKVAANPEWQKEYGGAWAQIEDATKKDGELFKPRSFPADRQPPVRVGALACAVCSRGAEAGRRAACRAFTIPSWNR